MGDSFEDVPVSQGQGTVEENRGIPQERVSEQVKVVYIMSFRTEEQVVDMPVSQRQEIGEVNRAFPQERMKEIVSILSFNSRLNAHYGDTDFCTPTLFSFFFLLQVVHRQTQICCSRHSRFSAHSHLHRKRP